MKPFARRARRGNVSRARTPKSGDARGRHKSMRAATRTLPRLLPSARARATNLRGQMPVVSSSDRPCSSASRVTGDAVEVSRAQLFCWDANNAGSEDVHLQANPTQAELLRKQFEEKKKSLTKTKKQAILEKYVPVSSDAHSAVGSRAMSHCVTGLVVLQVWWPEVPQVHAA